MNKVLLLALVLLGSACPGFGSEGAEVINDVPTFDNEIKPIFDRLCNECHGANPQQGGEFFALRYDVCEDSELNGKATKGAKANSPRTQARLVDGGGMPPAAYAAKPTPNDIALVKRWIEEGSPCGDNNVTPNNGTTGTNNGTTSNNGTTNSNNGTTSGTTGKTTTGNEPSFSDIAEILRGSCTDADGVCHQNDAGGLQITKNDPNATLATELQGNNTAGQPYVVPNDAAASRLFIRMSDPAAPMPPAQLLSPMIIDQIEAWINAGAKY